MPLKWFQCSLIDKPVPIEHCFNCHHCLTLPTLKMMADERAWTGRPSTTQLLNGTMLEFLKITRDYTIDPQKKAFALLGTRHHEELAEVAHGLGLPAEIALSPDGRDIYDLLEPENGAWTLSDYKTWGSYRMVRALGIVKVGKGKDSKFMVNESQKDTWESEMQLNHYRVLLEEHDIKVGRMQVQVTVRDGGLQIARTRGVKDNIYLIPIRRLNDNVVMDYFNRKHWMLVDSLHAYETNPDYLPLPCDNRESWDGARCRGYCEVAEFCPKGMMEQKGVKE